MEKGAETAGKVSGRIEWCDIFKGIMITWVVYSHSTHEFNRFSDQFGYQFVIAGLFFISGYTAKVRDEPVLSVIARKFYKLMVPYITIHMAGLGIFWLLQQAGILSFLSTTQYNVSYWEALRKFFEGNNFIYCDWLGAMWFVPVLFLAECIFTILTRVCRKDWLRCLISILLFLASDRLAGRLALSDTYYYSIDLAGMAHGFLMLGYILKKYVKREAPVWQLWLKAVLIAIVWWTCVRLGFRYTFDWPSRDVNGAVDFFIPLFGIAMMVNVSRLMEKNRHLKRLFTYLGRNSMGIMSFHFVGFKVAYLILILLGLMDASEAYRLIPGPTMAVGWPVIFPMGMFVSIGIWKGLNRFRTARILLGGGNAAEIYDKLMETGVMRWLRDGMRKHRHWKLTVSLSLAAGIVLIAGVELYRCSGEVEITFPCRREGISFTGGWLTQSEGEEYRWFEKRAEIRLRLMDQDVLEIKGYIPDSVEGVSYMAVWVNGKELYRENAESGQLIEIKLDLEEYARSLRKNIIEIETDGIRTPREGETDQRSFSAFINSIVLYPSGWE